MTEIPCTLFDRPGRANTDQVVALAAARAAALGLGHVVVASNTGETALRLRAVLAPEIALVCVTHQVGFAGPGVDELPPEARRALGEAGVAVLTATHLMAGIDRACRFKAQGLYPAEIVAHTLRILGQGVKVCVEIAAMALDAGLVPHGPEVLAVAGSGRGADAACVIRPAHGHDIFDTEVREILCMPRQKT